jgi:PAS domain S-box-containing protein
MAGLTLRLRLPTDLKLPLFISALLFLVIGGFWWVAYKTVQQSALKAAAERLERVTRQLHDNLRSGLPQRLADAQQLAAQPAIRAFLGNPTQNTRAAAVAELTRFTTLDPVNAAAEIWDSTGLRLLAVGRPIPPLDASAARALRDSAAGVAGAATGPLRSLGDSVFFPLLAPITVGRRAGSVVNWRRLGTSPQGLAQIRDFIGSGAVLYVGNSDGDVWTDLLGRVEGPPVPARAGVGLIEYQRTEGKRFVAWRMPIRGTAWHLLVEFPRAQVYAAHRILLRRLALVALGLIIVGGVGAWLSDRRTRASEGRLAAIVQAALDAHVTMDDRGTIVTWNAQAETVFGWPAHEVIGRHVADIIVPPAHREAHRRGLQHFLESGEGPILNRRLELRALRRDGTEIAVELAVAPIRLGNSWIFSAFIRDISERNQLEQQLRQAQKMEAVGRLAGGIAHDFNNLLTAIFGYADLLAEDLPPGSPAQADVKEIRTAATRAAALTRQLLAFSRQQVLQPVVLNVNDVVRDLENMLQRVLGEDVELEAHCAVDLANTRADPGQLEQVIINLAVNARDAMPTGGKLTIETANVELDEHYAQTHRPVVPGRYVMVAVSDTGIGMDAATQARVFEPFFTTKEPGKGTGLGLSTAYGIIKQSGGYIWVYSEVGGGATFKIYLPRVDSPAEVVAAPPELGTVAGTETVLLAEDDPLLLPLARDVLKKLGYSVLEARTAADAVAVAEAHTGVIHLLISDVVMPGESGLQLARRLLEVRPNLRVLYMSGYSDEAVVRHGLLDPGTTFLQKPFTPATLARKVRELLDAPRPSAS